MYGKDGRKRNKVYIEVSECFFERIVGLSFRETTVAYTTVFVHGAKH